MQRTLLSRPNLEQLVRLTDLDVDVKTPAEKEALFKKLTTEIEVRPITANLLSISYRDKKAGDGEERGAVAVDDFRREDRRQQPLRNG